MKEGPNKFGPFLLDEAGGSLMRDGEMVALGQKAFAVLAALVAAQGRIVSRAALMDAGWPDVAVEEGNLAVQISALRKALGSRGDWIVTVPRQGYRLLVPREPQVPVVPNLAVLPFRNPGGEEADDYFVDGVADDLITALSRFRSFAVIARDSAFVYRGREHEAAFISNDLGVRYLLTGSVRREGGRLRLSTELADAKSKIIMWRQSFDGAAGDLFDFQDRITTAVVATVAPRIAETELTNAIRTRPDSVAGYDVALRVRALFLEETEASTRRAVELLQAARPSGSMDARLLAYAAFSLQKRLAMGWAPLGPNDRTSCRDYAEQALRVDDGDALVLSLCGISLLQGVRQYERGFSLIQDGLSINPNSLGVATAAGVGHLHCGDVDAAVACFERAMLLSPRSPYAHITENGIAHAHMVRREYAEANRWAVRSQATRPEFNPSLWIVVASAMHLGKRQEAAEGVARMLAVDPDVTVARLRLAQPDYEPTRMAPIWDGLRMAGLPDGPTYQADVRDN